MERAIAMYMIALNTDRRRALAARPVRSPIKRAATIDVDMAREIYAALRVFYNEMIDKKMRSIRRPPRASRDKLVRARVACDLIAGWPLALTPKIKKKEAIQAAFECSDASLPNVVQNFPELLPALASANPVVGSNVPLTYAAYERVVARRAAKKRRANRR